MGAAVKICIYGAGSIGGFIAAHLARVPGCDVSVVARGATLDAIRTHGIRIQVGDTKFSAPVRAVSDPSELGIQDYVIIALKVHQFEQVVERMRPLIGPETAIYVVRGNPVFVFYDEEAGAEKRLETKPGDYIFVPPWAPHREENPDPENEAVVVIARTTQEAIVVNLPSLH